MKTSIKQSFEQKNEPETTRPKKQEIPLLTVEGLTKMFPVTGGFLARMTGAGKEYVHAVDGISFEIHPGEIFCLVGESGCGKTTTARILAGLETPTSGRFKWKGEEVTHAELKPKIGDIKSQIVFQNPYSSLNPRMKLGDAVLHPLIIHNRVENETTRKILDKMKTAEISLAITYFLAILFAVLVYLPVANGSISLGGLGAISKSWIYIIIAIALILFGTINYVRLGQKKNRHADPKVLQMFEEIGLHPPEQYYHKFPHEISGGERQRVAIARAISLEPKLLIADEPTSMLDVSLRAGILDLFSTLRENHDLAILFITHDLATARHFGDRVGVMYVGKLVELGDVNTVFDSPLHPYTSALIDAIPIPVPGVREYDLPEGDVADAVHPPSGCRFHPRCKYAQDICSKEEPILTEIKKNHWVACHFPLSK